ncbi:MAG: DUF4129 domain-containing protein [Chloroflexota bacterium]|nr:DUF4129 domain-containing protein [Chloroflexota bacterium]
MSQFWRASVITGTALYLEAAGAYLAMSVLTVLSNSAGARLPFWLVLLALGWSFVLSLYVQTVRFSLNLRGVIGLFLSALSLLVLVNLNSGLGFFPIGRVLFGDLQTAFALALSFVFLVALWWRGTSLAHDEVSLDTVRTAFQWGLAVLIAAVVIDSLVSARIVGGFMVLGFFAVGLFGLSLARFSTESADLQVMSKEWLIPISVAVGSVLLLAMLISGLGVWGLDDATRSILRVIGRASEWILRPILLGLGYIAEALVVFGKWLTTIMGGGDLSGLNEAQEHLRRFHEELEDVEGSGLPGWVYTLLKTAVFLVTMLIVGFILFRVFRFRRLFKMSGEVEEVRESLFTWGKANADLGSLVEGWWNDLVRRATTDDKPEPDPENPREVYHRFLTISDNMGHPKGEGQTPREHQGDVSEEMPPQPVDRIVGGFHSSHYGNHPAGGGEMQDLLRDLADLRRREAEWKEEERIRQKEEEEKSQG